MTSKKSVTNGERGVTRRNFLADSLSVAGLSLIAASGITIMRPFDAFGARRKQITIGGHSTTGTVYVLFGIAAKVLTEKIPAYAFTCISTSGSVECIRRVHMKEIEFAASAGPAAYNAVHVLNPFKEKQNIAGVAACYGSYMHVIALANKNIHTMEDLRGKKIGYGLPGSYIANFNDKYFAAHGLVPKKDFKPFYVSQPDAVNMMKDGHIDVFAQTATPGEPGLLDLVSSRKVVFIPVDKEGSERFVQENPYAQVRPLPLDLYGSPGKSVPQIIVRQQFCVGKWVDEELVYEVTKNFYEYALGPVHEALRGTRGWTLKSALDGMIPEVHPGAKRYYDEKGITAK